MKSASRTSPLDADTPFAYWIRLCLLPAEIFYEVFNADGRVPHGNLYDSQVMLMTAVIGAACGGAGLALWGLVKLTTICLHRTRRRIYYPSEADRRRRLAAERRKIRRRTTINAAPTAGELLAQFARLKRNPQEMIRFGSMLEDLEAYVDNSLRHDETGEIVGRNPGIKGWLAENCAELAAKYTTVMRYKALAKQFRQAVGLRDPYPAEVALPCVVEDGSEITVRTDIEGGGNGEFEGNEITERTSSRQAEVDAEIERARKAAAEFLGKCTVTQSSLIAELDARLRPELAPRRGALRRGGGSYGGEFGKRREMAARGRIPAGEEGPVAVGEGR